MNMTLKDLVNQIRGTGISMEEAGNLKLVDIARAVIKDGRVYFFKKKENPKIDVLRPRR